MSATHNYLDDDNDGHMIHPHHDHNLAFPLDHGRYSPSAWRPHTPSISHTSFTSYTPSTSNTMPPTTRTRPDRLANGYVDLTSAPEPPPPRTARKRESPTPGPSAKRHKRDHGSAAQVERKGEGARKVDEVDLTDEDSPLRAALLKQRADAVTAQTKPAETVTTFNSFNCVICMDDPTDLTATACGHLFCHTCLMEALIAGENRTGPHETKRSQCPVCRKTISRNKATDVIPLLLKKGLATQPRKKMPAQAAVPAPTVA